jgi:hypothetical protein
MRVVQRREGTHFAVEALAEVFARDLDCDVAVQPGIERSINLAHAASA